MADENVIEGQPWALKVTVAGGDVKSTGFALWAGKKVKFVIKGGPGGEASQEVTLSESGATTFNYITPKVPPNKANYKLTAEAQYAKADQGTKTVEITDTCTVWPELVTIKTKDTKGEAVPGVKLLAKQKDEAEKTLTTTSKGVAELKLTAKELGAEIKVNPPHYLKADPMPPDGVVKDPASKDKLREFDLTLYQTLTPKFVSITGYKKPVPPTDKSAVKTYVNLTGADPTGDELWGNEIEIEVGADSSKDGYKGKKDDVIYIEVSFGRESKRDTPAPALTGADPVTKTDKKEGGFMGYGAAPEKQVGKVTLDKDEGTVKFKVNLGYAGGDTCEIRLSGVENNFSGPNVPVLKLVNWRRLFYQLSLPQGATMPSMTRLTNALKEIFVEFIKYKDKTINSGDGPGGGVNWFDGAWVGESGKQLLNIGNYNSDHYHAMFDDDKNPVGVHIACCHIQYDAYDLPDCKQDFVNIPVTKDTKGTWSDGKEVIGITKFVRMGLFPKFLKDDTHPLVSGSWQEDGGLGSGYLTDVDVHIHTGDNQGFITVKLPDAAKNIVDSGAGKKVLLTFQVKFALGPYLGEAQSAKRWLQLCVIRTEANVVNDVMAHELGHTMNQVTKSAPSGLDAADHGRKYEKNGHQGPHCADGMSDSNYAGGAGKDGTDYKGNFKNKSECTCIMYGSNGKGSTCTGKFCKRCKPFLLAEQLTTFH